MTNGERNLPGFAWIMRCALFALACVLVLSPMAQAQYRTSIQGVVSDASGAVIPGAKLTLVNPATNEKIVRTTNEAGVYNFNALQADATFRMEVVAKGFEKKIIDHVQLVPDQSNGLNIKMAVGAETQVVTVDATAEPLLATTNANTVGVISEKQIQSMPAFGRDVFQLVQLTPGVFGDGSQQAGGGNNIPGTQGPGGSGGDTGIFATENGPQVLAHGGQYETNSYSVDGISTTSAVWGGTTIITPTADSVASINVVSNAYDAENGRFTGASVDVTTKSGTNQVHGSFFFTRHSPGLNAYQRVSNPLNGVFKDDHQFNQLGGSVGGPLWKNKLFGFLALETIQEYQSPLGSTGWYDTAAFDALATNTSSIAYKYLNFPGNAPNGTIRAAGSTCLGAGLTEGVNCRTIGSSGINVGTPLTAGLGTQDLTYNPSLGNPGVGSGLGTTADVAQYTLTNPTSSDKYQWAGRIDANPTKNDSLGFMVYWVPQTNTFFNGNRGYDIFHHHQINEAYTVIWNHTFSPTFLNELRGNVAGWHWNEISSNPQSPVGLPGDQIDNTVGFGLNPFGSNIGSYLKQWTYGFKDIATKIQGQHTLKFGVDYTKLYYLSACYGCGIPSYNFYNIWDFLNDAPHNESGTFNPATGYPSIVRQDDLSNMWGVFAQDDWKVRKNLTINLGLRWNYFGPLYEKHNEDFIAVPGAGSAFLSGMSIRKGGSAWNAQKDNFGPQIGFAWSPTMFKDKLVVRGGYGLNFNQDELALTQNTLSNTGLSFGPNFSSPDVNHINPYILYATSSDPHNITGYPMNPNAITTYGSNGLPTGTVQTGVALMQPNNPTMRTHHYSLDGQYDLGHGYVATVGYQGSLSRDTYFHMNPVGYAAAMGYAQNPNIGSCCDYWTHMGSANYNAMLAELKHQFSHQFLADVQYTWAKTMDTSSAPYSEQYYPAHPNWSYGRSDYNVGQAFKAYGVWKPVLFRGSNATWEKVAGGWSLSGIWNLHSGFPWNPVYNLSSSMYNPNGGYYQALPSTYLGGAGRSTSTHAYEYGTNFPSGGTAYFAAPIIVGSVPAQPGVARNSWTMPDYKDVDMTLVKTFVLPKEKVIGDAAQLQFRMDIYNLFNNLNLNPGSIQNDVRSSRFGQETSALGGRVVTLGMRFEF